MAKRSGCTDLWILDKDPGGIVVIFAKKLGKNLEKKLFPKEIIPKKGKKTWSGWKLRNKLCIKNEVFHVYVLNKDNWN